MKTKTAKDYEVDGHMDAEKRVQRDDLRPGSWQHAAYWKGRNGYAADQLAKARREEEQARAVRQPESSQALTEPPWTPVGQRQMLWRRYPHWPEGAREHLMQLSNSARDEKSPERRDRLVRACMRLVTRHEAGRELPDAIIVGGRAHLMPHV